MINFISFLIEYIDNEFKKDTSFSNVEIDVNLALDYNPNSKFPQINVYQLSSQNNQTYEVFCNDLVNSKSIQITWFCKSSKIDGKNYNAYFSAMRIGEKLEQIFKDLKHNNVNKNILTLENSGTMLIEPYDNTNNLYWGVIRFDINLESKYIK